MASLTLGVTMGEITPIKDILATINPDTPLSELSEEQKKALAITRFTDIGTRDRNIFRNVVTYCYDFYVQYGRVPSLDLIDSGLDHAKPTIAKVMDSPGFRSAMEARGVTLTPNNGLTTHQSLALSILTNPTDRRNLQGKLKAAGVTYAQYRAWHKNPLFSSAFNRLTEGVMRDHTGDVLIQLTQKAVSGDLNAIKMHLEVSGRHDPRKQDAIDVQAFMTKLMEILMKRVTDPVMLQHIANDLNLMGALGSSAPVGPALMGETVSNRGFEGSTPAFEIVDEGPFEALDPSEPFEFDFEEK